LDLNDPDAQTANWVRRRLHFWSAAVAFLFAILLISAGMAGKGVIRDFTCGTGTLLVLQGIVAIVLWPSACAWACRHGRAGGGGAPVKFVRSSETSTYNTALFFKSGLALFLMLSWTVLLARVVPHRTLANLPRGFADPDAPAWAAWTFVLALLTLAPIVEEIFFRHYLLQRIAWSMRKYKSGPFISILITAAAFGLVHYGSLEPFWLRFVQSAGLGIVLGVIAWQHGVETSIALHWLFNLILIPLNDYLR
jgi:membrane protease YdiL (CAAX protease family)